MGDVGALRGHERRPAAGALPSSLAGACPATGTAAVAAATAAAVRVSRRRAAATAAEADATTTAAADVPALAAAVAARVVASATVAAEPTTDRAIGLARVLAAMTAWGMGMLGRPRKGDEVRGSWVVLSVAATTPVPDVDDATYEFRVDGDVLQVDVRGGRLHPRHGSATDPIAVVTVRATTLVDLAFSRLELDDALARGRITVGGDQTADTTCWNQWAGPGSRLHRVESEVIGDVNGEA